MNRVSRWSCFEVTVESSRSYSDPLRDIGLSAVFKAPSGRLHTAPGFWDGASTWRIRFSPDETGAWSWITSCSDPDNLALGAQNGGFECVAPNGGARFALHGPLRVSRDRRHLEHADGTPFFWLGDTAWNGPLRATPDEWTHYLRERVRQGFNAVQWVATQWLASAAGDHLGEMAFTGVDRIAINPQFFQRLDAKLEAAERAGMLNVPVMAWAAQWSTPEANQLNPGVFLPEDQIILLSRHMLARWGARPLVWILPGDGNYCGANADRWKRIGRAVFGDAQHAPVILHPSGMRWPADEFREETWLDLTGYQSGHGDDPASLEWLVAGPASAEWKREPARPIINLEAPYEDHLGHHTRLDADFVRRALYWSLLNAPTAGVTYGGHGVWGWDEGTTTTEGHPAAGIPLPWRKALTLPAAEQVRHIAALFGSIAWWRLVPAPELLRTQPGDEDKSRFISVSASLDRDTILVYSPRERRFELTLPKILRDGDASATWFNPRDGTSQPVERVSLTDGIFLTPTDRDWVLLLNGAAS